MSAPPRGARTVAEASCVTRWGSAAVAEAGGDARGGVATVAEASLVARWGVATVAGTGGDATIDVATVAEPLNGTRWPFGWREMRRAFVLCTIW